MSLNIHQHPFVLYHVESTKAKKTKHFSSESILGHSWEVNIYIYKKKDLNDITLSSLLDFIYRGGIFWHRRLERGSSLALLLLLLFA